MPARRAICLTLLAVVAAAVPASAATGKAVKKPVPPRVITIAYSQPCAVSVAPTNGNGSVANCPADQTFSTLKGEKFASVVVKDASGQPASVAFNVASTGVTDQLPTLVCGSATKLPVDGSGDYSVNPDINIGDTGCPAPPTSGTITVTLTR